jgi:predicted XRE-type DNA-binding protein
MGQICPVCLGDPLRRSIARPRKKPSRQDAKYRQDRQENQARPAPDFALLAFLAVLGLAWREIHSLGLEYDESRCQGAIAMKKQRVVRAARVEEGSSNVYADLGYANSEGMLVKAELTAKIAEIIRRKALTQTDAARILGLTQPKVSALLKGQFRGISEHRLLECLTRLGRDVHIVIKPAPRSRTNGRLTLSVA